MRKITQEAVNAFLNDRPFKKGNTQVHLSKHATRLYLHCNEIAEKQPDGKILINDGGHQTLTTKERLNGLPNVHIKQKDGIWYLNGNEWDGGYILV